LAALFAYISGEDGFFKTEGGIRKKVLDEGEKIFPGLDLNMAAGALKALGLFERGAFDNPGGEDERFTPQEQRIRDFSLLGEGQWQIYWAAGVYLFLEEEKAAAQGGQISERFFRNRAREAASGIHHFFGALEKGRCYSKTVLHRFWNLLAKAGEGEDLWGSRLFESKNRLSFDLIMGALAKTGLLSLSPVPGEAGEFWKKDFFYETPSQEAESAAPTEDVPVKNSGRPVIAMDTAFSFILYPEISLEDALSLSFFCSVQGGRQGQETGAAVYFELSRSSAVRGFDQGLTAASMLRFLKRLSGDRVDSNLEWNLKDWETRYDAVSLHQGLVLTLAEDHRYLARAEPVASLIKRVLTPGVYLLATAEKGDAVSALKKAGVDIIAQPSSQASGFSGEDPSRKSRSAEASGRQSRLFLFQGERTLPLPVKGDNAPSPNAETLEGVKERFREILKKRRLSKAEQDELSSRIERRLVLSEAQLEAASVRYEKLEARGLDYVGKSVIAKQAIALGSLLEVSWPGPGGVSNHATGIPGTMEKQEGESVLVLKAPPEGEAQAEFAAGDIRIPLGKISLMRRIKQSIFEVK
jgi:hypothetical protein